MEEYIQRQELVAKEIESTYNNFKKSPVDRRTADYIQKHIEYEFEKRYTFEEIDHRLTQFPEYQQSKYYTSKFAKRVSEFFEKFQQKIESFLVELKEEDQQQLRHYQLQLQQQLQQQKQQQVKQQNEEQTQLQIQQQLQQQKQQQVEQQGEDQTQRQVISKMAEFKKEEKKRGMKIEQIKVLIKKLTDDCNENKSTQHYAQKLKQVEVLWNGILDNTEQMMDDEAYKDEHKAQLFEIHDLYDEIVIKVNEKSAEIAKKTTIKLPQISIKTFDGGYFGWKSFHDLFDQTICKNNGLSAIEKFQYLKSSVSGEANQIIQHIQMTEDNFETAWELLKKRYDNERRLVETYIKTILNLPTIVHESAEALKQIHDIIQECVHGIKNLKIEMGGTDVLLNIIVEQKLDKETIRLYESSLKEPRKVQKLDNLLTFIEERFHTLETIENENSSKNKRHEKQVFSVSKAAPKCLSCGAQHLTQNCDNFKKMTPSDRYKLIRSNSACINCLHPTHSRKECRSKHKCAKCQRSHHTSLHFDDKKPMSTTVNLTQNESTTVLLATAIVKCYDKNGSPYPMRALIDQGSQTTIITEKAAQLLRLERKNSNIPIKAIGNIMAGTGKQFINLQFCAANQSRPHKIEVNAIIMKRIAQKLPNIPLYQDESWTHLSKLKLADPSYDVPSDIDLLLGSDIWDEIVLPGLYLSRNGSPVAQKTRLGWILNGKISQANAFSFSTIVDENTINEEAVNKQLQRFWQMEEVGSETPKNEEERRCEKFYEETTIRDSSGIYTVKLPFFNQYPILGKSRKIAIAQLLSMEKKFRQNPELKKQYIENMREYFENNHIVEVKTTEEEHRQIIDGVETYSCAYLPHHAVIKTTSSTTKCRCVFDASRATTNGKSLNEQLLTGPTIQNDIMTTLSRWRNHRFVINGDIARMYRQIRMNDSDAEYQRIVWRENEDEPIRDYKLTTVTFGTTSAPYTAIKTIQQNAENEKQNFPKAAETAKEDFYVDDYYSGADTIQEAMDLQSETTAMLQKGGFQIRKWIANNNDILRNVPESEKAIKSELEFNIDDTIKTLGLQWNPSTDFFSYKTAEIAKDDGVPTKRQFLSTTAKIYDPIGWLGPTTILIKILYQQLWLNNVNWDEKIPDEINEIYQQYRAEFPLLEKIQIPRWIGNTSTVADIQLHGFCDASNNAYAAVIYSRIIDEMGNIHVSLLAAKTRVVPVKQRATIPKLELNAAVLLTRLFTKTQKTIKGKYTCFAWSDSTITLSWIKNMSNKLPSYVATRVQEIQSAALAWRYVPTDINPADCASRGLTPSQLLTFSLWWNGPSFLRTETEWPENLVPENEVHVFSITTDNENDNESNGKDVLPLKNFSSFSKLQRVVAYCQRFITNARSKIDQTKGKCSKKINGPLTVNELDAATITIIQQVQQEMFTKEIMALSKDEQIKGDLKSLNPFLDDNHIMRVNGRLERSNLPYHQKYPMILPKHHHVTTLLVLLAHLTTLHGGATLTHQHLRNKFWIPNGINMIKKQVRACQRCARFNVRPMNQQMAALPAARVNVSRPFMHTGVDFAGPIDIRTSSGRGQKTFKGYIAIFICLATKAIHIEAVSSLTSTAFIAAFRRFCGRRGQIKCMYSDCGSNFVGANRILKTLEQKEQEQINKDVHNALINHGIEWHFNPPGAPHFGGIWEAGVKSIKTHLYKMGKSNFTFEEFSTLLTQIESCLNSRPLCPINDDPNNLDILTPGHFLIGSALLSPPDDTKMDLQTPAITRWQMVQKQLHLFWEKWQNEYLHRLQQRPKWLNQRINLEVGDLVLIKDENAPPSHWLRGRVIKVHPGSDNLVRVATLKTIKGTIKRPIAKLCLLPSVTRKDAPIIQTTSSSHNPQPQKQKGHKRKVYTSTKKYALRPRITMMHIVLLMLIGFAAHICGTPFEVTTFTDQPGIYFEQTGDVRFITGDWTILVHYNLSTYFEFHNQHEKSVEKMKELCNKLNFEQPSCMGVVNQLVSRLDDLKKGDAFIRENQHHKQRRKRSPFDFVGYIASDAFGVLDKRYAKQHADDIEKLQTNEQHMKTLLERHTSVIQATHNVIHHNEEKTKSHFEVIERNLATIQAAYDRADLSMSEQKMHQIFLDIAMQTIVSMMRMETIQTNLINIIIDSKHGKLNPIIFPPDVAHAQMIFIKHQLSAELAIPIEEGIAEFYSSMKVRTATVGSTVIFEIKIPLQNSMKFQLYHIQSIPTIINDSYVFIQPSTDYILVNLQRDLYYPLKEIELLRCTQRRPNTFACRQKHPLYKPASGICRCELSLLKHQGMDNCVVKKMEMTSFWSRLTSTNKWLFVVKGIQTIDIICDNKIFSQRLQGAGYIQFEEQCVIDREDIVITSTKAITTHLNSSYTPSFNLSTIITATAKKLKLEKFTYKEDINISNLDSMVNDLSLTITNTPVNRHDVHHYVVIYIAVVGVIGLAWHFRKSLAARLPRISIAEAAECQNT